VSLRRSLVLRARPVTRATQGFSYAEVLLSVVLLGVLLVPALQALQSAMIGLPATAAMPGRLALQSKIEEVLGVPFLRLYAETYATGGNTTTTPNATFSDPPGAADRRLVVIYRYDASTRALSTADTGLAFVSVYYEAEGPSGAINTLAGRWW
jgi:type II secretory pathway component PulJ